MADHYDDQFNHRVVTLDAVVEDQYILAAYRNGDFILASTQETGVTRDTKAVAYEDLNYEGRRWLAVKRA